MNWRKWRSGLFVSIITGSVDGLVVDVVTSVSPKTLCILMVYFGLKSGGLWMKQHPVENIQETDAK